MSSQPAPAKQPPSTKGRQTQQAIETAARDLFAERGFHATTISDIMAATGKSPAVFYRYFDDKEDLLLRLADAFVHDVLARSRPEPRLAESPQDMDFFTSAARAYWSTSKENVGVMVAVFELAQSQQRFAERQARMRQYGMDIIEESVTRACQHGYDTDLNPQLIAMSIALLFEQLAATLLGPGRSDLGLEIADDEAINTLATVWKRTLYGL